MVLFLSLSQSAGGMPSPAVDTGLGHFSLQNSPADLTALPSGRVSLAESLKMTAASV